MRHWLNMALIVHASAIVTKVIELEPIGHYIDEPFICPAVGEM